MFTLKFETGNAAFDGVTYDESVRILRDIADRIEGGAREGRINDLNGNGIGSFRFSEVNFRSKEK